MRIAYQISIIIIIDLLLLISGKNKERPEYYESKFTEYVSKYKLKFKDNIEYKNRLQIYATNTDFISTCNGNKLNKFSLGENEFTYMTSDEFRNHLGIQPISKSFLRSLTDNKVELAAVGDPSTDPTISPSESPSVNPTFVSTESPSFEPSISLTETPSITITTSPTENPSANPIVPSARPSDIPSIIPSQRPTKRPTSTKPSRLPTRKPSRLPTRKPSRLPTKRPSPLPTRKPSRKPITRTPSQKPSKVPSRAPSKRPSSKFPTKNPSKRPSSKPTLKPTVKSSRVPSNRPTRSPTLKRTLSPTFSPTYNPTLSPTSTPSLSPTFNPTLTPTYKPTFSPTTYKPTTTTTAPVASSNLFDWTDSLTSSIWPARNQGSCGSCWAFAVVGVIEVAYFKKYGSLIKFSEQMLVSCDLQEGGCNGGAPSRTLTWVKTNGGLTTASEYPYVSGSTGKSGTCVSGYTLNPLSAPSLYRVVNTKTEAALQAAIQANPVIIYLQGDASIFQFYKSGVITSSACGGATINHAVIAVGYGTLNGVSYIKIRNSWGANWGTQGYALIASDPTLNICGIYAYPIYPQL